jgi:hypothetical protein
MEKNYRGERKIARKILLKARPFLVRRAERVHRIPRGDLSLDGELFLARLRGHRHEQALENVSPLEAVNGVLMLGMTSAALMAILAQLIKVQRRTLGHED